MCENATTINADSSYKPEIEKGAVVGELEGVFQTVLFCVRSFAHISSADRDGNQIRKSKAPLRTS